SSRVPNLARCILALPLLRLEVSGEERVDPGSGIPGRALMVSPADHVAHHSDLEPGRGYRQKRQITADAVARHAHAWLRREPGWVQPRVRVRAMPARARTLGSTPTSRHAE